MPHISIITTTYNHSDYIAHTIESVLSQTFDNWTMYIGDDSPDTRTWDIIATYVEKYPDKIKAYRNIPSLGIVGNMNRLLEHAVHSTYLTTNPSPSEKGTPSPIGEDRDEEYISFLE
jgi:glycosyltransferase involved in cell wall biosynthesis